MREKAPAYQRYPKQILGDDKVLAMDWDVRGMHNWLLDISWQQDPRGTIPADHAVLRRWLGSPSDDIWRRVWPQLSPAWPSLPDGRLGNLGMMRTAEKQSNYSQGNKGKEKYANSSQIGTQIERKHYRKNTEDEDKELVVEVSEKETKPRTVIPLRASIQALKPLPPESEDWVREIAAAHPRNEKPALTFTYISFALEKESPKRGSPEKAYAWLLARTKLYRERTAKWPDKQFIVSSHKWFADECYLADPKLWERGGSSGQQARNRQVIDSVLENMDQSIDGEVRE